jgi:hypothetical protein
MSGYLRPRPGEPSQGNTGRFAGGAVVPGVALIDTLPLLSQMVADPVFRQVGRAAAVGAASSDVAVNPAARNAVIPRYVISPRFVMSLWNLSGRPSGN